jgi:2-polyprenyl-3-methyl-5-hydroxy-6-metoxy-1,4-benzoquinol methylase
MIRFNIKHKASSRGTLKKSIVSEQKKTRFEREIEHGKRISIGDADKIWGWGKSAGRLRAERRARLIAASAGLRQGISTLEIGCGSGLFTEIFASYGCQITAVDISPHILEMARNRNLDSERVELVLSEFEHFDRNCLYDAVIGSSVLHHLDMEIAANKIFSFLERGGVMCFAEPNMLNPQIFIERTFRNHFPNVSPDETAFVRASIVKTLQNAGFSNIVVRPFDWLHPATPEFMIGMVSAAGVALEKIPLVREFAGSLLIKAAREV